MALVRLFPARKILILIEFFIQLAYQRRQLAWQKEELPLVGWQLKLQLGLKMVQPTHNKLRQMGEELPKKPFCYDFSD